MDEDILNNSNIQSGDILGNKNENAEIANQLKLIRSAVSETAFYSKRLDGMMLDLSREFKNSNKANFTSGVKDKASRNSNSDTFTSSTKKKRKGKDLGLEEIADGFLDGLEESIAEALGIPFLGKDVGKTLENVKGQFLDALSETFGIPVEDLPKEISKTIANEAINNLSENNPEIKKSIDDFKRSIKEFGYKANEELQAGLQESIDLFTDDPNVKKKMGEQFGGLFKEITDGSIFKNNGKGTLKFREEEDVDETSKDLLNIKDPSGISVIWDPLFSYLDTFHDALTNKESLDTTRERTKLFEEDGQIPGQDEVQDALQDEIQDKLNDKLSKEDIAKKKNELWNKQVDRRGREGASSRYKDVIMDKKGGKFPSNVPKEKLPTKIPDGISKIPSNPADIVKFGKSLGPLAKNFPALGKSFLTLGKTFIKAAGPMALAMFAAEIAIKEVIGPVVAAVGKAAEKIDAYGKKIDEVKNRAAASQEKRIEEQNKRYKDDVKTMIEEPFNILKKAAKEVEEAWDDVIGVINQTQGYNKSDLQDLMTSFANRLKSEGLDSVIGTTDVTTTLKNILESGLSGKVAEEFAYISTVLKKAVPAQNFEGYAESYASMVSQFMSQGASQSEALSKANKELQNFVSNTISASRATGGLETNLNKAENMFGNIIKLSQNARGADISKLSSTLAIVQAITGQYQGVGDSIVNKIIEAAIGGNGQDIVALRSLAGTGASNTAFLQALAKDPNSVLATMFKNLGQMIDTNSDNYMEVAHKLEETFGIKAQELVQINWSKLSGQLSSGILNNGLNENMSLLKSGESTTTAESQKIQMINEQMIEQGLAYVLDNEAARTIQEHMWDQEIAEQNREATYAVELQGAALEALSAISGAIDAILKVLMGPLGWFQGVSELVLTQAEGKALQKDLKELIEAGKVGKGNQRAFHDLTTYDVKTLQKPKSLLELWGKSSSYYGVKSLHDFTQAYFNPMNYGGAYADNLFNTLSSGKGSSFNSKYSWSTGKSSSKLLASLSPLAKAIPSNIGVSSSASANTTIASQTMSKLESWVGTMESAVSSGQSFDDWFKTSSNYGIKDAESALKEHGQDKVSLESQFKQYTADEAAKAQKERNEKEEKFWETGEIFWTQTFPTDFDSWMLEFGTRMDTWTETYSTTMENYIIHLDEMYGMWLETYNASEEITHTNQQQMNEMFNVNFVEGYLKEWKDYYIGNHTNYYTSLGRSSKQLSDTINKERRSTGEGVLALAKALTQNESELLDPQLQGNALLAQLVQVNLAILQALNSGGGNVGLQLPNSLAALGLNLTGAASTAGTVAAGAVTGAAVGGAAGAVAGAVTTGLGMKV